MVRASRAFLYLASVSLPVSIAKADEGMWTFDAFPAAKMRADYGWAPDQAWLDKVRSAAVRLTGGCSASFVSDAGLILTNHHCVATCVEQNSTGDNNILKNGFTARTREEEKMCAGQQAETAAPGRADRRDESQRNAGDGAFHPAPAG